jgi:hypothetical protein
MEAPVSDNTPLTSEERVRIARAPITVGILATHYAVHHEQPHPHGGIGPKPFIPMFNSWGQACGRRSMKLGSGENF